MNKKQNKIVFHFLKTKKMNALDLKQNIERLYNIRLKEYEQKIGHNSVTYSDELDRICRQEFGSEYGGIFSRDEKFTTSKYNIVNTTGPPGEHWVAVVPGKNSGEVLVYDSFARPNILGLGSIKHYDTELDAEQFEEEQNCGQRCLAFISIAIEFGPEAAFFC